jgi:hypothetical protein
LKPLGSYKGAMVDSFKKLKTLNLTKLQTYKTNTTKVLNLKKKKYKLESWDIQNVITKKISMIPITNDVFTQKFKNPL